MLHLNRIHKEIGGSLGGLRIPKCLQWNIQTDMDGRWRIRMIMNRIQGTSLSSWMVGKDLDFHKATMMALTLLRQFAPLLHIVEQSVQFPGCVLTKSGDSLSKLLRYWLVGPLVGLLRGLASAISRN